MTMMMFAKPAAAVFALLSLSPLAAEKLVLKPAPDFHSYTQCCGDDAILFVRVNEPPSTDFCEMQTTMLGQPEGETDMQTMLGPPESQVLEPVCGGTFFMNLALYDGLEFSFQAPEGKEIVIQSDENNRVEFQFQAKADCDVDPGEYIEIEGNDISLDFTGSDVGSLEAQWNPGSSVVLAGRCAQGCSQCELFATFQLGGEDESPSFTGRAYSMSWSVTYDSSVFATSEALEYRYDTSGYSWIRTIFDNATLVDASPSTSPSTSPDSVPPPTAAAPTATPPFPSSDAKVLVISIAIGATFLFTLLLSIEIVFLV